MISWLQSRFIDFFGVAVPPAFVWSFCDLLVTTTLSIAFGRFGGRLKVGSKNG